jgi:hypothetical protein
MKKLSQSLEHLAARVKTLEDSAAAAIEADRTKLEQRRHEIDDTIKSGLDEFDSAVQDAAQAGRTWWNDARSAMKRPLDEVRARVEKRQSEQRAADAAEEDAAAAVEVATYFLNVAEYAVVDAALARMAADHLAVADSARSVAVSS